MDLNLALALPSCRKGEKEGGREEMGVMEGIRALTQPHRWSLLRKALRKELDNHPYQVDRLSFLREGLG